MKQAIRSEMLAARSPRGRWLLVVMFAASGLWLGACKRKSSAAEATELSAGCIETNAGADITPACMACLRKNALDTPVNDGCCGVRDPEGMQLCQAVSACMRAGGPPVGRCNLTGDTTTCFCGKHQADCDVPGRADGPCVAQITAAAGRNVETGATDTPTAAQILDRYGKVSFALGRASNIAAIAGALCKSECGLGL
jgi:hypothetical protein